MPKQRTLNGSFTLQGKGLHTGVDIQLSFFPAPENHGCIIKRIDLEGQPTIPALAEYVTQTTRGTVLANGDAQVSTIEHAMAALFSFEIDNCLMEVNAPEFPILDGSAKPFVEMIESVGFVEQDADKDFFIVKKKIEYNDPATNSSIVILPDDHFSIQTMIGFKSSILSNQYAVLNQLEDFATDIAACRTFVFVRELEQLLKMNLIKGGDLENALVIYDEPIQQAELDRIADLLNHPHKKVEELGYLTPLQFENEPARHKLLDVMGDLALIGKPIKGKVIATRPGHKVNTALAKAIRKDIKRQEVSIPVYDPNKEPVLNINQIKKNVASPLAFFNGRQGNRHHPFGGDRAEECNQQRNLFYGTFPQRTRYAGCFVGGGNGTNRRIADIASGRKSGTIFDLFHENRQCQIQTQSCTWRHCYFPVGTNQSDTTRLCHNERICFCWR
jgi:UDP-3-0-acyl N-acetylglucosamine deacetylase